MTYNIRNLQWVDHNSIDLEWEHPVYGWIPFTAHEDDVEAHGREIFAQAKPLAGPYAPREPEPFNPLDQPLDRLQFWLVAASAGISKWSVRDRIAAMPEGVEKNEAIAWFEDSPRYRRDDPLVISLAAAEGIPPEQLDALWIWAVGG